MKTTSKLATALFSLCLPTAAFAQAPALKAPPTGPPGPAAVPNGPGMNGQPMMPGAPGTPGALGPNTPAIPDGLLFVNRGSGEMLPRMGARDEEMVIKYTPKQQEPGTPESNPDFYEPQGPDGQPLPPGQAPVPGVNTPLIQPVTPPGMNPNPGIPPMGANPTEPQFIGPKAVYPSSPDGFPKIHPPSPAADPTKPGTPGVIPHFKNAAEKIQNNPVTQMEGASVPPNPPAPAEITPPAPKEDELEIKLEPLEEP